MDMYFCIIYPRCVQRTNSVYFLIFVIDDFEVKHLFSLLVYV